LVVTLCVLIIGCTQWYHIAWSGESAGTTLMAGAHSWLWHKMASDDAGAKLHMSAVQQAADAVGIGTSVAGTGATPNVSFYLTFGTAPRRSDAADEQRERVHPLRSEMERKLPLLAHRQEHKLASLLGVHELVVAGGGRSLSLPVPPQASPPTSAGLPPSPTSQLPKLAQTRADPLGAGGTNTSKLKRGWGVGKSASMRRRNDVPSMPFPWRQFSLQPPLPLAVAPPQPPIVSQPAPQQLMQQAGFATNPTTQCLHVPLISNSSRISYDLVIMILSSRRSELSPERRRAAVRQSWAKASGELGEEVRESKGGGKRCSVRYLFVLGGARMQRVGGDDLLLLPVEDGYRQISHKVIGAMRYISETIEFKYLLKTDDDSFVCLARLLEMLRLQPRTDLYLGVLNKNHSVVNDPLSANYERWRDLEYIEIFSRT